MLSTPRPMISGIRLDEFPSASVANCYVNSCSTKREASSNVRSQSQSQLSVLVIGSSSPYILVHQCWTSKSLMFSYYNI